MESDEALKENGLRTLPRVSVAKDNDAALELLLSACVLGEELSLSLLLQARTEDIGPEESRDRWVGIWDIFQVEQACTRQSSTRVATRVRRRRCGDRSGFCIRPGRGLKPPVW